MTLQSFEKWAIDFVVPIQPQGKIGATYIITTTEYLTHWLEAQLVKDCTGATAANFLFEYVLTQFHCPKILMSDHNTHFLNETISALIKEFKLTRQTPFQLVYGVEAVMPMEYIMPSLRIAALTGMTDRRALEERLAQLDELDEEIFLAGFHQQVQKQREKAWHDWHIKLCTFKITDGGVVQLVKLNGEPSPGKVNGSRLKPYTSSLAM
eukprot:PITA_04928